MKKTPRQRYLKLVTWAARRYETVSRNHPDKPRAVELVISRGSEASKYSRLEAAAWERCCASVDPLPSRRRELVS